MKSPYACLALPSHRKAMPRSGPTDAGMDLTAPPSRPERVIVPALPNPLDPPSKLLMRTPEEGGPWAHREPAPRLRPTASQSSRDRREFPVDRGTSST